MLEDIKDIKGPVYFPVDYFFLIVILSIVGLSALGFLISYLLKKRARKRINPSPAPPRPAHDIAYEALDALKAKNLPRSGKIKEYYSELSDIVRRYLENRFDFRAPEMTTEEFLYSLRGSSELTGAHKNLLKQFLSHCDLVKFAKYGPTQIEIDESFNAAKKIGKSSGIMGRYMATLSPFLTPFFQRTLANLFTWL